MEKREKRVLGLAHVGIPVSNLEASKEFYNKMLDLDVIHENQIDSEEGTIDVCFMRNNDIVLELYQMPSNNEKRSDGYYDHVAYKVENIEDAKDKLIELGIEFMFEDIVHCESLFENGAKWILFRGPDGEIIELNEIL